MSDDEQEAEVPDGVVEDIARALQEGSLEVDGKRSIVYGWAMIVEWVAPDGQRWLSKITRAADGHRAPEWQSQGYFWNALHSPHWDEDDDG